MKRPRLRGMSLIDVIVGIALMLIVFLSLFGLLRASLALSFLSKEQAVADEVASSQMEYLRGFSYDALGTQGGIPAGTIPQDATTTIDGIPIGVHTYITYYDDPADGLGANDTNHITTDYKKAVVTVSYEAQGIRRSFSLVSNFAPPGIETNTGGGTLAIHVVNAQGQGVSGATVRIINNSLTPNVNFYTLTDTSGLALIGGAATSSQYQIYVSKGGYNSAQTYPRTAADPNPSPGPLTVVKSLTTSQTFISDLLAHLTLESYSPATTTAFSDSFTSTSNIAGQKNTQLSGGGVQLVPNVFSGSIQSIPISPSYLTGWGALSAKTQTSSSTAIAIHVLDGSGALVPDSVLPGNSAGFSSFPVSLANLATSTYPTLSLSATLSTQSTSTTPILKSWSLSHTQGPMPSPNLSFTLTGTKTIGSNASNTPIYKTVLTDSTGSSAQKTESLEFDQYTLSGLSAPLLLACPYGPYPLSPAQASTTQLIVGKRIDSTLPVQVLASTSAPAAYARVTLTKGAFIATQYTSVCGTTFFNGLPAGTYSGTVSNGRATTTLSSITVSGATATTTAKLP